MKPPSIMFLNPSGRFEVGKKVCLSVTSFHPELWQPAWGIRTILEALLAFLPMPADGALGALQWRPDERRKLAAASQTWRCPCCGPIAELVEGGADDKVLGDGEAATAAFDAPVLPWDEGRAAAPAAAAPAAPPAAPAPATPPAAQRESSDADDAVLEVAPPPDPARAAATEETKDSRDPAPAVAPSLPEASEPAPATSRAAGAEETKAPEPAVAPADNISLNIRVDYSGGQTFFKIKRKTKMRKVFDAFATQIGVPVTSLIFEWRGGRVGGGQTAAMIGLRDSDQLDAKFIAPGVVTPEPAPPQLAAPAGPVPTVIVDSLIAVVSVALVAVVAHKYLS